MTSTPPHPTPPNRRPTGGRVRRDGLDDGHAVRGAVGVQQALRARHLLLPRRLRLPRRLVRALLRPCERARPSLLLPPPFPFSLYVYVHIHIHAHPANHPPLTPPPLLTQAGKQAERARHAPLPRRRHLRRLLRERPRGRARPLLQRALRRGAGKRRERREEGIWEREGGGG